MNKFFLKTSTQPKFGVQVKRKRKLMQAGAMLLASLFLFGPTVSNATSDTVDARPNIVLLVIDDAGYSDLPRFGGEALTPAMDSLADTGMTLTQFHVLPTCSPTRSELLTGVDNHLNGMGTMQGQIRGRVNSPQFEQPGYIGYLNKRTVTIATLLKDAGYNTYMTGKWHLGLEEDVEGGQTLFPRGWWPIDRGFTQSYGVLEGGGEHYGSCERAEGHCTRFFENDTIITASLPADYFSGKANMDKALEFIDNDRVTNAGQRKPFFLYYADTLVHEPNQVPDDYIKQERIDQYLQQGWDGMRALRFQKMKDLGIIPASLALPARDGGIPDWNNEDDPAWDGLMAQVTTAPYNEMWRVNTVAELKRTLAKKMAVYTGMLEYFDSQVGRLVTKLKDVGEFDNTVFVYFSDNGGDARNWDFIDRDYMYRRGVDNSYENIGRRGSFVSNGPGWAQVTNTSLLGNKASMTEGGIRAPFVISYVNGNINAGSTSTAFATVKDVAATVLEYAGVTHPVGTGVTPDWNSCTGTYNQATDICPMSGKGLVGLSEGIVQNIHRDEPVGFELFGAPNRALFLEDDTALWKIRQVGLFGLGDLVGEPWQLHNLTLDPSEASDLSLTNVEQLKKMVTMYEEYDRAVGIIPRSSPRMSDVAVGDDAIYTVAIANHGPESDTFTLACQSEWACILSSTTAELITAPIVIAAGASVDVTITVTVPANGGGMSNTTQVTAIAANQREFSTISTVVTRTAKAVDTRSATSNDNNGGGGLSANLLLLLLAAAGLRSVRRSVNS